MISVVSMHWKRTENTHKILESLKSSKLVNDVIIWNNNPSVYFQADSWVRVVNTSEDFGLNTRFGAALYAKNECVLTLDDDNLIPEATIQTLHDAWKKEPNIIHTLDGRIPTDKNEYGHDVMLGHNELVKEAPMSMTRCAMYHRKFAAEYFQLWRDLQGDLKHSVDGNGEDLMMSYLISAAAGGKLHKVYRLPRKELPAPHAIHGKPGHKEFRTELMRRCQQHFNLR